MSDRELPDVLESVAPVVASARFVRIDESAIRRWAAAIAEEPSAPDAEGDELLFRGGRSDGANFVLLSDALNFCFWSDAPWSVEFNGKSWTRTYAMMAGLLRAVQRDPCWLTWRRWADATLDDVDEVFRGVGQIPLAARRRDILRETGTVLGERWGGQFSALVDAVQGDALALARAVAADFPSFRDVAVHAGRPVAFLKRAQICAADLHRLWIANGHAGLTNLESLTVFADYRLPQLFRHVGLMRLDDRLAARIDRGELLEAGSAEEVEIRAASVWIGRLVGEALAACGRPVDAWELDYELWLRARDPAVTAAHHRTLTHFY